MSLFIINLLFTFGVRTLSSALPKALGHYAKICVRQLMGYNHLYSHLYDHLAKHLTKYLARYLYKHLTNHLTKHPHKHHTYLTEHLCPSCYHFYSYLIPLRLYPLLLTLYCLSYILTIYLLCLTIVVIFKTIESLST